MSAKKTEKTKARLLQAVRLIIALGDKPSVAAITKKAQLAYGTFYRYFKDLDEIYYEDIVASLYERNSLVDIVEKTTEEIFVPVTVGGGLRHVDDVAAVLRAGADKVSINTEAIKRPQIIQEVSDRFGSQCLVLSIQAKQQGDRWEAYFDNGRERSGVDVLEWVEYGETSGAGEILLTSVDREGTSRGFDLSLTKAVTERVEIPVIASGGMGCDKDLIDVVKVGGVDAVAMAHVLHYEKCYLRNLREKCRAERIPVRVTDC